MEQLGTIVAGKEEQRVTAAVPDVENRGAERDSCLTIQVAGKRFTGVWKAFGGLLAGRSAPHYRPDLHRPLTLQLPMLSHSVCGGRTLRAMWSKAA